MYTMELVNLLDENLNLGTYFDKLVTKSEFSLGERADFPPRGYKSAKKI